MRAYTFLAVPMAASSNGPLVQFPKRPRQRVFLAQGDIDGACGHHSIAMALIAFGVIDRLHLVAYRLRRDEKGDLVRALRQTYFDGIDADEIVALLRPFSPVIAATAFTLSSKKTIAVIQQAIASNDLVIAGIEGRGGRLSHWVLIVGLELHGKGTQKQLRALLLLDASEAMPTVSCWNARIEIDSTRKARHRCIGIDGSTINVEFNDLIVIGHNSRLNSR